MKRGALTLGGTVLVFLLALGSVMGGPITFLDVTKSATGQYLKKQAIGPAFGNYDNDGDMDIYVGQAFNGPATMNRNNRLWKNQGNGTFINVAREQGIENLSADRTVPGLSRGISWADCDNDGDLDFLMGNHSADPPRPLTAIYINGGATANPPYSFTSETCTRGLYRRKDTCPDDIRGGLDGTTGGAAWGDYNSDGCLDIIWRNTDQATDNALFENVKRGGDCTCTFTEVTKKAGANLFYPMRKTEFASQEGGPPRSLVLTASCQGNANWVDYDNDGDQDLFHPNDGAMNVLFRNDGGTFTDVTTVPGREANALANIGDTYGACWGDIDNDRDLDCYITNSGQANRLVRNDLMETGKPGFTDITFEQQFPPGEPGESAWPDSGAGDFGDATSCTMGDYDNDGYLDIYVNNGGPRNSLFNDTHYMPLMQGQFFSAETAAYNVLLRNNGNSTFTDVTEGSGGEAYGEGRGVATGDYDDDGLLDLYVTSFWVKTDDPEDPDEFEGVLLQGTTDNSNNWLKVELVGTVSNRSGIGARVECTSPSFTQIREVASAHGYNSQDDPRAHFGLGSDTTVTSIKVTWPKPNLSTQTLPNPAINKVYVCTEGSGCAEK
jgi:hypothetical protein